MMTALNYPFPEINGTFENVTFRNDTGHYESFIISSSLGLKMAFMTVYFLCFLATLWLAQGFFRIVFSFKAIMNCTIIMVHLIGDLLPADSLRGNLPGSLSGNLSDLLQGDLPKGNVLHRYWLQGGLLPGDLLPENFWPGDFLLEDVLPGDLSGNLLPDLLPGDLPENLPDLQQGNLPPGELLPENVQPGALLPGHLQSGNLHSGDLRPGNFLPGNLQPDFLPGNMLPGKLQPDFLAGNMLPGNMQPGNFLQGNLQPDFLPRNMLPGDLPPDFLSGDLLPGYLLPNDLQSENKEEIPISTFDSNHTLVEDLDIPTLPPVSISDLNKTNELTYDFSWYSFVHDFIQSSEESVTGLFFYEVYQCVCSTEVRNSISLVTRAIHISAAMSISLVLRALQEGAKFLLVSLVEANSWPTKLVHFGVIQSVLILAGMIYMMVEIVVSLTKAARFREQQQNPSARKGFSNFLYFLPFVFVVVHFLKLISNIFLLATNILILKNMHKCFSYVREGLLDGENAFFDDVNCIIGGFEKTSAYSESYYFSFVEFCYVLLHLFRKKIAEKER